MLENFNESYKKLNKAQREAVDSIEGPVMVIAGPGTGKTQILSLRIANILKKTDVSPDSILALTFTESGVYSMRKRLASMIGNSAYRVNIFTFHSFCNNIIKTYPEDFPRIISSINISPLDELRSMEKVIEGSKKIKQLRPYGDRMYYLDSILKAISDLKRENITPDKLDELIDKEEESFKRIDDLYHDKGAHKGKMKGKYLEVLKHIERNKELSCVYRDYEEILQKEGFYDYNDMIIEVVRAMESNSELLLKIQENYQYLLVDEHQDTNNAQNRVLELISGFYDSPNLFIVGDEKQAIFRFQGASLNNFLYFKDIYKDAKIIFLEDNYRSTQNILDSAHSLIEKSSGKGKELRKKLVSKCDSSKNKLNLAVFSSPENEIFYVAEKIKEMISCGNSPGDIAVIYRDNKDAFPISLVLEKYGIPFAIESDQNVLEDSDVRKIIYFLEAINEFGNDRKFAGLLHFDLFNINEFSIYKLVKYAKDNKKDLTEMVHKSSFPDGLEKEDEHKIKDVYDKLNKLSKFSKEEDFLVFFEFFLRESGFLKYFLSAENSLEKVEKLSVLFENIKSLARDRRNIKLADFIEFIRISEGKKVFQKKGSSRLNTDCVHLLTAHRSKGMEFGTVFITGLFDGHFGNRKNRDHFKLPIWGDISEIFDNEDDERRLFYVAITRAKREVYLSYSKENTDGKPLLPSQFIPEIDPSFISTTDVEEFEKDIALKKIEFIGLVKKKIVGDQNKQFLNELFLEHGLSVTALNNYLKCPWSYFYRNLLRIPEAPSKPLMYGNSIHYTLKDFFNKLKEDFDIGLDKILEIFRKYAKEQPFNEIELSDSLEKGEIALSGYYDKYKKYWCRNIINELNIRGIILESANKDSGEDLGIYLTGNIDKIEILDNSLNVNVVDYKTGVPKSRNEIEGKTKNSEGEYKRQLVFYKILLDAYDNGKYKMASGEIDFIEPDSKGNYKKEKFFIEDNDVLDLKDTIRNVAKEILDLSFWDKRCDDKKCEYCKLREMMTKNH